MFPMFVKLDLRFWWRGGGELSDVLVCMNVRLGGCQLGLKEEQEGLDPKTSKDFLNPSQEFYEGRCQLYVWSIKS